MYKKYDSTLLVQIEAPSIICSFRTEQKSEMIEQIEVSAIPITTIEIVKNTLSKSIAQLQKFNERIDREYPNSVAYAR